MIEAPAQFNGNIAWIEWKVVGEPYQAYGFQYDGVNRLTQAIYEARISRCQITSANYDCYYGYDGRGNFTSIQRNGFLGLNGSGIPQYGQIDNLSFQYTGANTLYRTAESANYTKGFLGSQSVYTYDHGRLTNDSGKNANVTKYNFLNQPQVLKIGTDPSVTNFWDANGNLHKQIQHLPGNEEKVRYYQDGIEYITGPNDEILIESIHHGEGRYVYEYDETGKFKRNYHEFMISDHLGNVRVRFADLNGDGTINIVDEGPGQEKEVLGSYHYYPYGMRMEGIFHPQDLVANNYRYNGIEYLEHQGLNVSLATWRTHDAAIGRWWQVDSEAESMYGYNPFNAMGDNPVSYSDPDGDLPFLALLLIGAATGVLSNGISNTASGNAFFEGAGKAALWGGVSAAVSAGIGFGFGGAGGIGKEIARGLAHGISGGMLAGLQGGEFAAGFASGGVSSGIGSALSNLPTAAMIAASGLSGGIGSAIGGGSFWNGFGQGVAVSTFNHALHSISTTNEGGPQKGDTRLSEGTHGELLVYDGTEWCGTDLFYMASGGADVTASPLEYLLGAGVVKGGYVALKTATGGLKQWIRIGGSFSVSGGFKTYAIRWGASPKHAYKIGSNYLREVNQWLRQVRVNINSWRTSDAGHFHLWKK